MKKLIVLIVIVILIIGGVVFYLHHRKSNGNTLPTVTVKKGTITEKAQAIGYIKPLHSSTVKSPINGSVEAIYHYEGEYVKKNTPLIKIKPEPEPADYATAYEAVEEALVTEKNALRSYNRFKQALKSGLITKNYTDYINARNSYETAKAKRMLAEQKLALLDKGTTKVAKKTLANIVKSPISGYILSRNVDIGDPVISLSSAQASTALYTMANMNDLMFEGSVDETDASKIHLNMPATVSVGAAPKQLIKGILTKIALQSDQETAKAGGEAVDSNLPFNVSFKVQVTKLKIPTDMQLRAGYSATANIKLKQAKNVLIIPERVLHFADSKVYVLLPPEKSGQQPGKQYIKLGLSDGMNAEVTSGLRLGQKVVDKPDVNAS